MNLLAELYNNQQNITQNPTGTIRTPRQIAYDNWLNAQQQAQNTTKDEWGQAIGNSVNGLAKIISSAVVKNPYERAGATRNLDNFDDRQDQLVRDWAMQRMKNRNDFVQQAKEQLGLATADEEREYAKQQNELNRNDRIAQQERAYQQWLDQFNYKKERDEKDDIYRDEKFNIEKQISNLTIKKLEADVKALQFANTPEGQQAKAEAEALDKQIKEAQKRKIEAEAAKIERENSPEYLQQQQEQTQKEAEDKINQEQMKKNQERVFTLMNNNSISPEDGMVVYNNPELYKYLKDDTGIKNKIPFLGSKKKLELDYEAILKDQNIPVTRNNIKELKKQLGL